MAQEPIDIVVYVKDGMVESVQTTLAIPEKTLRVFVVDYDVQQDGEHANPEIHGRRCSIDQFAIDPFSSDLEEVVANVQTDATWKGPTDSDGAPCRFTNHYHCSECDIDWTDQWSSTCDDECPECGTCFTPTHSEDA